MTPYSTEKQAQSNLSAGGLERTHVIVFVSPYYAALYGVLQGGWYIFCRPIGVYK